jgi:hypothetical protein
MMQKSVTIVAVVDENRHLEIDLPADAPTGPVELTIRPVTLPDAEEHDLTREAARAKLHAAGILSTTSYAAPDAVPLSSSEREQLGRLFAGPQSIAALIDEERGSG